jgi:hypothetical protein
VTHQQKIKTIYKNIASLACGGVAVFLLKQVKHSILDA